MVNFSPNDKNENEHYAQLEAPREITIQVEATLEGLGENMGMAGKVKGMVEFQPIALVSNNKNSSKQGLEPPPIQFGSGDITTTERKTDQEGTTN